MRLKKNTFLTTSGILLTLLIILTVYLQFWILNIRTPLPEVSISVKQEKPTIHFGVISRYSPRQIYQGYQPFMDYLTEHTPYRFELRLSHDYEETVDQLLKGKVDFASLGNYVYVRTSEDHDIRCIAKPVYANGETHFNEVIIVHETSSIHSIDDLKNRSFAFASSSSFSFWMTQFIFFENGMNLDVLSRWENHGHHETVVEKVLKGDFDAGTVKGLVAMKHMDRGLRIIYESVPIPGVPLVAGPHASAKMVAEMREALVKLTSEIAAGDLVTSGWDEEVARGFAPAEDEDYDITRNVLNALENFNQPAYD